jgi:hypothetical protein
MRCDLGWERSRNRQLRATTPELLRLAEWLKARQVESVAMESTAVYWIAPHEVLDAHGFEVLLGHAATGAGAGAGQKDGCERLRMDSAAAQLRLAAGIVPAGGSRVHAAHAGAG